MPEQHPQEVLADQIEKALEWTAREFPALSVADVVGVLEMVKVAFLMRQQDDDEGEEDDDGP